MCCIFGVGFLRGHKVDNKDLAIGLVSVLAREAEIGGLASSGISIMREKNAHVLKRAVRSSALIKTDEYQNFMDKHMVLKHADDRIMSVIGHCRLPTKGSATNNNNNHPIVAKHIIGVHNGIISNDDELFKGFSTQFTRIAQVDTEIIFQLLAHFAKKREINTVDAIEKVTTYLKGGYACAVQNANHPYNLYLFRRSNPIRVQILKELGLVMFATREGFITKALDMLAYTPKQEEMEIMSESGVSFNLNNRTFAKFNFPR